VGAMANTVSGLVALGVGRERWRRIREEKERLVVERRGRTEAEDVAGTAMVVVSELVLLFCLLSPRNCHVGR